MIVKTEYKGKTFELNIPESEYWVKRTEQQISKYWKDSDNLEKRMSKEFLKAYKELEKELYTFIGKYGQDGVLKYSNARIIALMKQIKPYIDDIYAMQQMSITELLMDQYENNYLESLFVVSKGLKITSAFIGINETAIKTAISYPWSGENFSDAIYKNKNKMLATLKQELTQGMITGASIQKMSANVKNRLDIGTKEAQRLIRTESTAVLVDSSNKAYKDFGLDKYEYIASLDEKTCDKCAPLDGKVFLLDEMVKGVNAPPLHPHDRCDICPSVDIPTGERLAKDVATGKYVYIPGDMSYTEWKEKYVK